MTGVVVVGGGPAGSATALHLARAGVDVTLVERAQFPRRKVCGEYQNSGTVEALERLGVLDAVRAIAQPLHGIRLVAPYTEPVELPFPRPALACDRASLDALLLDTAIAAGVRVQRGRVEDLAFDGTRVCGVVVRDESGERRTLRARFVVGADGMGSIVAKKLGVTLPPQGLRRFALGGHYRGFGDLRSYIEMYIGGGAYFAINPLDTQRANVMVVVPDVALERWSGDVDAGMRGKAAELGRGHRSFAAAERIGERVAIGPLVHRVKRPVAPGAVLVGDAAGFLNPFTGQGVYLALAGAQAASTAILASLTDPAAEGAAFVAYARERERDFGARKRLSGLVSLLIDRAPLARRAVSRLQRSPLAASALVDAVAGVRAPASAFSPAVLARLLL